MIHHTQEISLNWNQSDKCDRVWSVDKLRAKNRLDRDLHASYRTQMIALIFTYTETIAAVAERHDLYVHCNIFDLGKIGVLVALLFLCSISSAC